MKDILIKSKRAKMEKISKDFPGALILDVTSKGPEPWIQFSPFYPHGDIPIPFSESQKAQSVEGIWQGLKVFTKEGIDVAKFYNKSMKNIKRSIRTCGPIIGHQLGINSEIILDYREARKRIYIPAYHWVLENRIPHLVSDIRNKAKNHTVILLDYQTNQDINNIASPLSHAGLIKSFIENGVV